MIEAGLEFPSAARRLTVATFLSLPEPLRPTHRSAGEEDVGARIRDPEALLAALDKQKTGFFLKNELVVYSIRLAGDAPMLCDCFLDVPPPLVQQFLRHMADAHPVFGFACRTGERERQNRVTTTLGVNTITSWIGRDTGKYVPGLYWLTLLPAALAARHDVPLDALQAAAVEHEVLAGDQHLLRFYASPDDWSTDKRVPQLIAATPGIFDPEAARARLAAAKTFLDLNAAARAFK